MNKAIEQCLKAARENDAPEGFLDDIIIDMETYAIINDLNRTDDENRHEEIISGAEHKASEINNRGLEAQIRHILESWGVEEGVPAILEVVRSFSLRETTPGI